MQQYAEMARFLQSKRHTPETLKAYFCNLYGKFDAANEKYLSTPTVEKLLGLVEVQPGHEMAAGSWWDAFNTVTFFNDHVKGRTADARLQSSWYGQGRVAKVNALESAVNFAQAA